jgi:hypothetical protein
MDVKNWIYLAIGVIVILSVTTALIPSLNQGLGNFTMINNGTVGGYITNPNPLPFSGLFATNGIIVLLFMAALLVLIVFTVMKATKK